MTNRIQADDHRGITEEQRSDILQTARGQTSGRRQADKIQTEDKRKADTERRKTDERQMGDIHEQDRRGAKTKDR